MQEEIINKLHTALYPISPLTSDREQIIEQMGETIWLESLEKILEALPEGIRNQVVECLNTDNLDGAIDLLMETDVDVDAIITQVATSVMDEVTTP